MSIALEQYGRQAKDVDLETWAAEIKLRAWRRLGEISRGLAKRQNQHDALPIIGRAKNEVLAQAGVSVQDASRAEAVAAIDEGVFEQYAAKKKAKGEPVYVQQAIKDMTGKKPLVMPTR